MKLSSLYLTARLVAQFSVSDIAVAPCFLLSNCDIILVFYLVSSLALDPFVRRFSCRQYDIAVTSADVRRQINDEVVGR